MAIHPLPLEEGDFSLNDVKSANMIIYPAGGRTALMYGAPTLKEERKLRKDRAGSGSGSDIEIEPRVKEAVLKAALDGRIDCPAARELAGELGVDPGIVGEACNQLRIKIKGCALGCF